MYRYLKGALFLPARLRAAFEAAPSLVAPSSLLSPVAAAALWLAGLLSRSRRSVSFAGWEWFAGHAGRVAGADGIRGCRAGRTPSARRPRPDRGPAEYR